MSSILPVQELKRGLKKALSLLPDRCLLGLMTFGALVALHELSSDTPKAFLFRGDRAMSGGQVRRESSKSLCALSSL